MQNIKEDIKNNKYKPIYLLYGCEDYLKKLYKNKLKDGILGNGDEMNYSHFEGKGIDLNKVVEIAQTLPFFSERRLIIIEDSGLFKGSNELADFLKEFPDSTHIVFVEQEIDKRNRLYKAVKEIGTISEMNGMDEKNLKIWVLSFLKQNGKKITEQTMLHFLNKVGSDMQNIMTEMEKLVCYTADHEVISVEDIEAINTTQLENKIFQMVDAISNRNQQVALELYYDLLALKEKPMSILFLITRQFNLLLQVKELYAERVDQGTISKKIGVPPFAVKKYIMQSKNYQKGILLEALNTCAELEEQVKTGRMNDKIAVEVLIVRYSQNK